MAKSDGELSIKIEMHLMGILQKATIIIQYQNIYCRNIIPFNLMYFKHIYKIRSESQSF